MQHILCIVFVLLSQVLSRRWGLVKSTCAGGIPSICRRDAVVGYHCMPLWIVVVVSSHMLFWQWLKHTLLSSAQTTLSNLEGRIDAMSQDGKHFKKKKSKVGFGVESLGDLVILAFSHLDGRVDRIDVAGIHRQLAQTWWEGATLFPQCGLVCQPGSVAALQIQRVLCIEVFLESVIQSSQKSKPVPWKGNEKFDLIFSILTELQNRQALLCLGALLQGNMSQR